jgi:hypothetical protein
MGMLLPGAFAAGGALLWVGYSDSTTGLVQKIAGAGLIALGASLLVGLGLQLWFPRIGYGAGYVRFNLRSRRPLCVPIDVVEAFLLGQGPALLPGEGHRRSETRTVVVRLSEKAQEWSQAEVNPRLASWCDSYITIRGTWCEPLDVDVIKRLNRLLAEASRESAGLTKGQPAK